MFHINKHHDSQNKHGEYSIFILGAKQQLGAGALKLVKPAKLGLHSGELRRYHPCHLETNFLPFFELHSVELRRYYPCHFETNFFLSSDWGVCAGRKRDGEVF